VDLEALHELVEKKTIFVMLILWPTLEILVSWLAKRWVAAAFSLLGRIFWTCRGVGYENHGGPIDRSMPFVQGPYDTGQGGSLRRD